MVPGMLRGGQLTHDCNIARAVGNFFFNLVFHWPAPMKKPGSLFIFYV